jgi:hypothetical protein
LNWRFTYLPITDLKMRHLVFIFLALWSCASTDKDNKPFTFGEPLGAVESRLSEASGLAASISNPGLLWTLNDSGNPAEVFLIDTTAQIKMACRLANIKNRDWEDVVIGPGPDSTKSYLYVADIGDNAAVYPTKILYRFEEPVFTNATIEITDFDTLYVKLDDGIRDTEAIMIDPLQKGMYLLSKREDSVHFYKVNYPYEGDTLNARYRVKLPYHNINAAEISPDGTEVVIKDYDKIYYWKRPDGGPISKLLQTPPVVLNYKPEQQGESITFSRRGSGFYTLSETETNLHGPAKLMFYKRK